MVTLPRAFVLLRLGVDWLHGHDYTVRLDSCYVCCSVERLVIVGRFYPRTLHTRLPFTVVRTLLIALFFPHFAGGRVRGSGLHCVGLHFIPRSGCVTRH